MILFFFVCFFFNLVFGKKVKTASEILYFYICWVIFIYTPLSLDVFKRVFLVSVISCLENVATKKAFQYF